MNPEQNDSLAIFSTEQTPSIWLQFGRRPTGLDMAIPPRWIFDWDSAVAQKSWETSEDPRPEHLNRLSAKRRNSGNDRVLRVLITQFHAIQFAE